MAMKLGKRTRIVVAMVGGFFLLALIILYWVARQHINLAAFIGRGEVAALQLPAGFRAEIFAEGLRGPRFMQFGPDGQLYVADRNNDRIVRLPDTNTDGRADDIHIFADEIDNPHSLVYHQGAWYVGVPTGVLRLVDSDGDGRADQRTMLIDNYTPLGQHSTRTVQFLPDGRLLVAAGSTCNVCEETDARRAAITVYDSPVGQDSLTGETIYASGLRNPVGLAIHPETGELWASNNGRDLMGDDIPPENIFRVREGGNYGWPYCHSGHIVDPDYGQPDACAGGDLPITEMQAHMAPLGIAFYTGDAFPSEYKNDLFIALHGSWNRSQPVGYKIMRLPLDGSQPTGPAEDFITGWLTEEGTVNGRPVDVAVAPDGSLYISDDKGGFIYRITYDSSP